MKATMEAPDTTSTSDFHERFEEHLRRVAKSKRPTLLTRGRKTAAVVMSAEAYRAYEEALEFMDTVRVIEESRRQVESGRSVKWADARARLLAKAKARATKRSAR